MSNIKDSEKGRKGHWKRPTSTTAGPVAKSVPLALWQRQLAEQRGGVKRLENCPPQDHAFQSKDGADG